MIDFKKLKKIPREGAVQIGDLLLECASWNNDRKDKRQNVGLVLRKRGLSEFLIKWDYMPHGFWVNLARPTYMNNEYWTYYYVPVKS